MNVPKRLCYFALSTQSLLYINSYFAHRKNFTARIDVSERDRYLLVGFDFNFDYVIYRVKRIMYYSNYLLILRGKIACIFEMVEVLLRKCVR